MGHRDEEAGEIMTKITKAKRVAPPRDEVEVIVCKESELNGAGSRMRFCECVLGAVAEYTGGEYHDLDNVYILRASMPEGDPRWALDHAFKKYDLYNVASKTASARVASAMADDLKAHSEADGMVGTAVIRTMLDRVYAKYDIIRREANGTE